MASLLYQVGILLWLSSFLIALEFKEYMNHKLELYFRMNIIIWKYVNLVDLITVEIINPVSVSSKLEANIRV